MTRPSQRDRRIRSAVLGGLIGSLLIGGLGVASGLLARRTGSNFLHGFTTGLLLALPLALAYMFLRAYRQMDEYGQRLHQRAGSAAFLLTMLATACTFALQPALRFEVPLWAVYVFGMLAWAVATAVISVRERGRA